MAQTGTTSVADVQLSRLERLPWRRIVLVVLSLAIGLIVALGAYRTLTLDPGYTGVYWGNLVVLGLAQGAIYAMIALGYGLVYGILKMINFAHGEVFMVGAFGSFFFADAYAKSGFLDRQPVPAIAVIVGVAMALSGATAVLLERLAYRPLRTAPRLVPLITAIGASLFLQNAVRGFFGPQSRGFPRPSFLIGSWSLAGVEIPKMSVATFVVVLAAMLVLQWFVSRTRTGRSMRAVSEDREIASLMGIDVDRTIVRTFLIGGFLAGIAGVLYAMTFESVDFFMGFNPGISAFTAAVLGGIGSIGGAAIGGLLLGVIESVGPYLILSGFKIQSPTSLKPAFTFVVLVIVLVFRPAGLLGSGEKEKV